MLCELEALASRGLIGLLRPRFIEPSLTEVEEERKTQGHPNQERGENGQPEKGKVEPAALRQHKHDQDHRRDNDIQGKESAEAGGKEFLKKERKIQAVCCQPWNELRVRQDCADDAQAKIKMAQSHELFGSDGGM